MKPHKWAKEIKAWADGAEIEYRKLGAEKWRNELDEFPYWDSIAFEYRIKLPTKCITKDCLNHVNEGEFVGELCAPCWDYIANGKGVHSQAYRNAQPKEPQYLYVFDNGFDKHFTTNKCGSVIRTDSPHSTYKYIGKIKLEVDDE